MRALIVEDQPVYQAFVLDLLTVRFGAVEHCFADSVERALQCMRECQPDFVVAAFWAGDVREGAGLEDLVAAAGRSPVVALDYRLDAARVRRVREAGAKAYIVKTASRELIDAAIGVVAAGGEYFPRTADEPQPVESGAASWVEHLSARQATVLRLVVEGKTNREIAEQLGISLPTVKLHVHHILRVAGVRNRTEAALRSRRS
jgi:DNA-binding NarL/FixJ family response regulator